MDLSNARVRVMEEGLSTEPEKLSMTVSATSPSKSQSPLSDNQGQDRHRGVWQSFSPFWIAVLEALRPKAKNKAFEVVVRQLKTSPKGYPSIATFLDSDESFMVYRRFGYLQARLLLDKQDELRALERRLDKMDNFDASQHPTRLQIRDLKKEDAAPRRELLKQIEEKFREYASLMVVAQQLVSFNKPAPCDYQSVVNYMDHNKPLIPKEAEWIHHREDMVTLRAGREHAWLDASIEHFLKWMQCSLGAKRFVEYLFCSAETKQKSHGLAVYYTRERIERAAVSIIILAILALLVIPIALLYHLVGDIGTRRSDTICIGVLLLFTLAFSAVLSLFTKARRHEILAAAAAYCAVLVVFLGNVGSKVQRNGSVQ